MSENNTKARAAMVRHLAAAIRLRGLQTAEAAAWLDVPQEKIEAMQRGDADTFSLAELEAMAQAGERRETEPQIPADTVFHLALYERLQPHSEWRGGRLADTDLLTLEEAAAFASKHAGEEITARDFLRAAGRGEITLRAIVHRAAKVRKHDGGVYCNKGEPNENIVPAGCIANLPLTACQRLANAGRASWRTFDSFEAIDGIRMRYTKGMLTDDEPDFETVPDDCRVVGYDVHALADEYCAPEDAPQAATPAPVVAGSPDDGEVWKVKARDRANDIIKRQQERDYYPSQENIADKIAREFRKDGIVGAGGKPLTGAYIKRHALKGISSAKGRQLSTSIRRGK